VLAGGSPGVVAGVIRSTASAVLNELMAVSRIMDITSLSVHTNSMGEQGGNRKGQPLDNLYPESGERQQKGQCCQCQVYQADHP